MKFALIGLLLACTAFSQTTSPAPTQSALPPSAPPAAPRQPLTSVFVSVLDGDGKPAQNLGAQNFAVSDDRQDTKVAEAWPATDLPVHLAVVLLASKTNFSQEQDAAAQLVKQVLRPNIDKAFVITSGGDRLPSSGRIDWATTADAFQKAVRDLKKNEGLPDAFGYKLEETSAGGGGRLIIQRYNGTGTNIFDVINQMWATDPRPARRVVVMFRDPISHSPGEHGVYSKQVEAEHAFRIAAAQQAHTPIFMIGVDEPKPVGNALGEVYNPIHAGDGSDQRVFDEDMNKERDFLISSGRANAERMADQTGGHMFFTKKKNYTDAVAAIANLIQAQYVVSFVPAQGSASGQHPLKVDVSEKGAHVYAPKGYIGVPASSMAAAGK
jgi:VWFA-related protein